MDSDTTTAQLTDAAAIGAFILAGNATFTVVSDRTGTRFTFKAQATKGDDDGTGPVFVKVLTGPSNSDDYTYLGTIFRDGECPRFVHTRKSRISRDAPSARGFAWLARQVFNAGQLEGATFHHEGRCCRCGRALTVPESIATGWGPECRRRAA